MVSRNLTQNHVSVCFAIDDLDLTSATVVKHTDVLDEDKGPRCAEIPVEGRF